MSRCRRTGREPDRMSPDSFYVERFLRAFPALLREAPESPYWTPEKIVGNCYSLRTLQRFAEFLGLVEVERVGDRYLPDEINIRKLPLLDMAVRFQL